MRTVLHLIETGGPGGAEMVFAQLVTSLDATRWRSIPVIPEAGWLHDRLRAQGFEPVVLPERSRFDRRYWRELRRIVREERVDVIHGHLFGSCIRAAALGFATGRPAIGTLHGLVDLGERERLLGLKIALLDAGLASLVFVSDWLRRALLARGLRVREELLRVVPNGIDLSRFDGVGDTAVREELSIPPDAFLVGSVGNPSHAKGLDLLLRATASVASRVPALRVVIAGDLAAGRGAELLALRDELRLGDVVTFTGLRHDVPRLLSALDAYVLSSRSEGFSLSLVEALAAGLPAIATRCGGPEEIIDPERTGLLVENESAAAIADAIVRLWTDAELRRRLGENARRDVRARYDLDRQVAAYEALYVAAIEGRAAPTGNGRSAARALQRVTRRIAAR